MTPQIPPKLYIKSSPATEKEAKRQENQWLIYPAIMGCSILLFMAFPNPSTITLALLTIATTIYKASQPRENIIYGKINDETRKINLKETEQEFQKLGYQKVAINGTGFHRLIVIAATPWNPHPKRREYIAHYQLEQCTPENQLIYRLNAHTQTTTP